MEFKKISDVGEKTVGTKVRQLSFLTELNVTYPVGTKVKVVNQPPPKQLQARVVRARRMRQFRPRVNHFNCFFVPAIVTIALLYFHSKPIIISKHELGPESKEEGASVEVAGTGIPAHLQLFGLTWAHFLLLATVLLSRILGGGMMLYADYRELVQPEESQQKRISFAPTVWTVVGIGLIQLSWISSLACLLELFIRVVIQLTAEEILSSVVRLERNGTAICNGLE